MKNSIKLLTVWITPFILVMAVHSQSLTQIGARIKKALPQYEHYAVIVNKFKEDQILKDARVAQLVIKKNFTVYGISYAGKLSGILAEIMKRTETVVIVLADSNFFDSGAIQLISKKLRRRNFPLVSTRPKDTFHGATFCVIQKGDETRVHVNKMMVDTLGLKIKNVFLTECIIDVE